MTRIPRPVPGVPVSMGSSFSRSLEVPGFLVTHARFDPGLRIPPHHHERACVALMLDGAFDVQFRRVTHPCPPRVVVIEPAGETHGNRVGGAGAEVLVLQPDPAREDIARPCAAVLGRIVRFRHEGIARTGSRLVREIAISDTATPLVMEAAALEILAFAARLDEAKRGGHRPPSWLRRAAEMMHDCFLEGVRAFEIAREVGVHPVHLARVFRRFHGVSLGAYLRGLRLDWAGERLRTSDDPLERIALDAGFADQSHFTRAFKGHTGLTPAEFRARTSVSRRTVRPAGPTSTPSH